MKQATEIIYEIVDNDTQIYRGNSKQINNYITSKGFERNGNYICKNGKTFEILFLTMTKQHK